MCVAKAMRSWNSSAWGTAVACALALLACMDSGPAVAEHFDPARFQGHWYEIARIPRDYDARCEDTTADYRLVESGSLELVHRCRLGSKSGSVSELRATLDSDDPDAEAKLTIELGLYRGAYWVLDVGNDYEYAVIGHPSRAMAWILARTPEMEDDSYARALDLLTRQGFATQQLRLTPQSDTPH